MDGNLFVKKNNEDASIHIVELSNNLENNYTEFLIKHPLALAYHTLPYCKFVHNIVGGNTCYQIAINDGGSVLGVLPLMYKEGKWGRVYNSLPYFGSHGGILSSSQLVQETLTQKYNQLVSEDNVAAATLISHPFQQEAEIRIVHNQTDYRIGQWTRLPHNGQDIDIQLMEKIDASTRRNIRKAYKEGVTVYKETSQEAINFLKETHIDNMEKIGGNLKTDPFFLGLSNILRASDEYDIYIASLDGKWVAALLLLLYKDTIEYFVPVTLEGFRNFQPMAAIIYQAMQDYTYQGYKWWNWGGTWKTQKGVYRFKKKWAAQDFKYYYYCQINNLELMNIPQQSLLSEYEGFYIMPFFNS